MADTQYRVYVTPQTAAGVYGTETEISDWVIANSQATVDKTIDSTDFSIGIYTYQDVTLSCAAFDGYLSGPTDSRSLFKYSRDLAKIRIVYDDGTGNPISTFRGLIVDSATVIDPENEELTLTVTSPDSVINTSQIAAGTVPNGTSFLNTLFALLSTSDITSVLNFNTSNINPSFNGTVDVGSWFDNQQKGTALNALLGASNSVLVIDANFNIIVKSRFQNSSNAINYLYGKGYLSGTDNILSISNYNTGLHRVFNSIFITGGTVSGSAVTTEQHSAASILLYGFRQKKMSLPFMTNTTNMNAIATALLSEFAYAKIEMQVEVPTADVVSADLLDLVSVTYPLDSSPAGKFLPIIGITTIGDTNSTLPYTKGSISVDASLGFKIIEKQENVDDTDKFTTILKIRQIGSSLTDGGLPVAANLGGSALVWDLLSNAPMENDVGNLKVLDFDYLSAQGVWALIQVPSTYVQGVQIKLVGGIFATTATSGNVLFTATAYLVAAGSTVLGTYSNSHASINTVVAAAGVASTLTAIGNVDLTDSSGLINGVAVSGGNLLLINLVRNTGSESGSAQADARFIRSSMIPQFS